MKKLNALIVMLFCYAALCPAQTFTVSQLKGGKWVMDDNPNYYVRYTDTQEIVTFLIDGKECNAYSDYYLSYEKEKSFDKAKVGKRYDGNYIIIPNEKGGEKGNTSCALITYLDDDKLVLEYVEGAPYTFHRK